MFDMKNLLQRMHAGWAMHEASWVKAKSDDEIGCGAYTRSQEECMIEACDGDKAAGELLVCFSHWGNDIQSLAQFNYGIGLEGCTFTLYTQSEWDSDINPVCMGTLETFHGPGDVTISLPDDEESLRVRVRSGEFWCPESETHLGELGVKPAMAMYAPEYRDDTGSWRPLTMTGKEGVIQYCLVCCQLGIQDRDRSFYSRIHDALRPFRLDSKLATVMRLAAGGATLVSPTFAYAHVECALKAYLKDESNFVERESPAPKKKVVA